MTKSHLNSLGWVFSFVLLGILIGGGFQGQSDKIGVADLGKIAEGSAYYKQSSTTYDAMVAKRRGLIDFFNQYKVPTSDQSTRIVELSLKDGASAQEQAELDRLKQDVIAQDKRYKELTIKASPTPEETTLLQEFSRRANALQTETIPKLSQQFTEDVQSSRDKIQTTALEKARDAVREIGKQQGYTVVLSATAAPYGANDISDAALKAMDSKK